MTHPSSFSQAEFAAKKKLTPREQFLPRLEALIPWTKLLAVLEPFYPEGERGRPRGGPNAKVKKAAAPLDQTGNDARTQAARHNFSRLGYHPQPETN